MKTKNLFLMAALLTGLGLIPVGRVTAQTFTTLHSFTGGSAGALPYAGLIANLSGNTLYGTTYSGGSSGAGTVFAVNNDGTGFTTLHSFTGSDGANPAARLILSDTTLYGTANVGGSSGKGMVFAVNTDDTGFTTLHSFTGSDGTWPKGLILSGNTLYGTTYSGGSSDYGTVFAVNTDGTGFTTLHSFTLGTGGANPVNSDGAHPYGELILAGNTLYGTAEQGGSSGYGTVFKLNANGTGFTTLHSFIYISDGAVPDGGLILSGNTLYGTAFAGGSSSRGTVFAVNTDGTGFTNLHSFTASSTNSSGVYTNSDGANPYAGLVLSGHTLYGTTYSGGGSGEGTVFQVNTDGTGFTTLHSFTAISGSLSTNRDGATPYAGLILSGNTLYGTAAFGGSSGMGTVFSLSLPPPQLTVRYVDVNSASPVAPYTSWATAATNIQDAVDAAVAGDAIVVTNGIYATGGRYGNRVAVDKPLSLRSINGPQSTTINGGQSNRCVYLTNGASLSGFTLTNGFVLNRGFGSRSYGGGLLCESTNAMVSNCVVSGNSVVGVCLCEGGIHGPAGGGVYGGTLNDCILGNNRAQGSYNSRPYGTGGGAKNATLNNCTLSENSAALFGGGASGCTLNNCTLSGNGARIGGGAEGCTLNNCTLGGNRAAETGGGADSCTLNNCTLSDNRAYGDYYGGRGGGAAHSTLNNCTLSGNSAEGSSVNAEPGYGGGTAHSTLNNCTLSGNSATDSFPGLGVVARGNGGGAWSSTLNNCIVYFNTAQQGANYDSSSTLNYSCTTPQPTNGVGNITNEPAFVNFAAGNYRLRPDSPCIDAGTNLSASITNDLDGRPRPLDGNGDGLAAFDMGAYEYRMPLLVWQDSPNPTPPHADWATAAHTIQDAVDAAVAGDEIVVTNGIYTTGVRAVDGFTTNRVAVDKPLTLRSVNGARFTAIRGEIIQQPPDDSIDNGSPQFTTIHGTAGLSGIRCVYLTNSATLSGFTLTNGSGGVFCASLTAVVSNCVLAGNDGRGAYGGTLNNCTLTGNSGGGAYSSLLNNCALSGNWARGGNGIGRGGGAAFCTLNNCTMTGNTASGQFGGYGGGAADCTLHNCTLSGNVARGPDPVTRVGGFGGGAYACTLNNCIVYFNTASHGANYDWSSNLNYSCTTPLPTNGVGNITNAPLFVDEAFGNLRLQSNSPCINAGLNAFAPAGPDLDGNLRIRGDTVDIGAYEFQLPTSIISYAWLQQYALPIDGSADTADPDGDHMNNWQEWRCATDPTNQFSLLKLLTPQPETNGMLVRWQSVNGHSYSLERAANAGTPFSVLQSNLVGQAGTTSFTDTNTAGGDTFFYRVGVEE